MVRCRRTGLQEGAPVGEGSGRGLDRPLVGEGFLQVVEGPHLDGFHRGRGRPVPGHHDDGRRGVFVAQGAQNLQAVPVGEPDVQEDDGGAPLPVEGQRLFPAGRHEGLVSFIRQDSPEGLENPGLVVYDQDQLRHRGLA